MAADDTGNTGDQRVAIHQLRPCADSLTVIGDVKMSAIICCSGVPDMSAFTSCTVRIKASPPRRLWRLI
jgi:hypothetical protein